MRSSKDPEEGGEKASERSCKHSENGQLLDKFKSLWSCVPGSLVGGPERHSRSRAVNFRNSSHQPKRSSAQWMRTSGEKSREHAHAKTKSTDQAPRQSSRVAQLGDTPDPKGGTPGDNTPGPKPGPLGSQPDGPHVVSAQLQEPWTPRRCRRASTRARALTSRTCPSLGDLPPARSACEPWAAPKPDGDGTPRGSRPERVEGWDWTGSREGPAPRVSGDRIGRDAARVPPLRWME